MIGHLTVLATILFSGLLLLLQQRTQRRLRNQLQEKEQALNSQSTELATAKERALQFEKQLTNAQTECANLREQYRNQQNQLHAIMADEQSAHAAFREKEQALLNQIERLEQMRTQLKEEFQQISLKTVTSQSESFASQNQSKLKEILAPLQERIHTFEKQVANTYDQDLRDRTALKTELHHLRELNRVIADEAINLTRALKADNKAQGCWGELVMERLLEAAGLTKGRDYQTQQSFTTENGRFYPDAIIHLPDEKSIILDSKVSLIHYEAYSSANDDSSQQQALAQHLQSIRNHIKGLSDKRYQNLPGLQTVDFVLLFIPIEGAYAVAIQQAPELLEEALRKNILLVTPSSLLGTLRVVAQIWRIENQNRHAQNIATEAGKLYDKFADFTKDLEKLGQQFTTARKTYSAAMNKLTDGRGNLISRAEKLRELGAEATKNIPKPLLEKCTTDEL